MAFQMKDPVETHHQDQIKWFHDKALNGQYMLLTPDELVMLLNNNFPNVKHEIIQDCLKIKQSIIELFANRSEININYLFVSGGYFFKYDDNNILRLVFQKEFNEFKNKQAIDFFYTGIIPKQNTDTLKYSFKNLEKEISVYSRVLYISNLNVTFQFVEGDHANLRLIDYFDAECCKIIYCCESQKFFVPKWFILGEKLNLNTLSEDRALKFKMKGFE